MVHVKKKTVLSCTLLAAKNKIGHFLVIIYCLCLSCIGNMQMIERLHLLSSISNHYVTLARKWENQGGN